MPSHKLRLAHKTAKLLTIVTGIACVLVMTLVIGAETGILDARIIRIPQKQIPWKSIKAAEIERGVDIPADTHVVFQLPEDILDIEREILFGWKGTRVRYWGYCIPQNEDDALIARRQGLPGLLFLSETERAIRYIAQQKKAAQQSFTVDDLPTPEEVERAALHAAAGPQKDKIRHQLEVFSANMLCYIMTEQPLAMGMDSDGDKLNDRLEQTLKTDAQSADTDSDGLSDYVEAKTGTSPTLRDTDSDGLIDGVEDKNFDGNVDIDETDPATKDTDRDDLCDGLCRVKIKKQEYYMGEDQNLNGKLDQGETDPLIKDTDDDGIPDYMEFLSCVLEGKTQCP